MKSFYTCAPLGMLSLLTVCSVNAHANDSLFKKIRYECDDQEMLVIEPVIEQVIVEGLSAFETINPEVGDALRDRLRRRKLTISCTGADMLSSMHAGAVSKGRFLAPYRIQIGDIAKNIPRNGKASISQKLILLHELLHYARIDNYPTSVHNTIVSQGHADTDNVYSCSYSVYPSPRYKINFARAKHTCENASF